MPPVKAVLDTNVVISAFLKAGGREALVFRLGRSGAFVPVISEALLGEYKRVLGRTGFGFDPQRVREELGAFRKQATLARPREQSAHAAYDPADDMVLDCALAGGAAYVVTGNARHFPEEFQGIKIIRPRQFLVILAAELE